MLLGLGAYPSAYQIQPGDTCFSLDNYQPAPCSSAIESLLCQQNGQVGRCSSSWGSPVPVFGIAQALQYCGNQIGCQITTAAPCDPLFVAAGFQNCSQQGLVSNYTLGIADRTGPNQYNAPVTAQTINLSPTDANWLAQQGIIQPVTSGSQVIQPTWNPVNSGYTAPPPTSSQWGGSVGGAYGGTVTQPVPVPIAQPMPPVNLQPIGPLQPVQPISVVLPPSTMVNTTTQPPAGSQAGQIPGGTIPGSNTAQNYGGMQPQAAPAATTGDLIPGLPNNTLYIGAAALLLLLVLKK